MLVLVLAIAFLAAGLEVLGLYLIARYLTPEGEDDGAGFDWWSAGY